MHKKIAFISNYSSTYIYISVSKFLCDNGIDCFWIVFNNKLFTELKKDFSENKILLLNRNIAKNSNTTIDEFKLNELIYGDRTLKYEMDFAQSFLTNIQFPFYNFIKDNKIEFIFGELTWAHEILFHRICTKRTELNCKYLNPQTIRIPTGRFAFFEDEFQSKILKVNTLNHTDSAVKEKSSKVFLEKPEYLSINNNIIKESFSLQGRLKKIKRFIFDTNIEKDDPTLIINKLTRLKIRFQTEINRESYRFLRKSKYNDVKNKKYIVYAFHKQPEASIDTFGRYYENQFNVVENIWRILPSDYYLVIKEHTNALGDRGYSFLKKLLSYKNVVLIDENTDSHLLIENAVAVFAVTGTIAYEAAMKEIPSFTFVPTFFNGLNGCKRISIDTFREINSLYELIGKKTTNNKEHFFNELISNSFEGIISNPITNKESISRMNIQKLVFAIKFVICKNV